MLYLHGWLADEVLDEEVAEDREVVEEAGSEYMAVEGVGAEMWGMMGRDVFRDCRL